MSSKGAHFLIPNGGLAAIGVGTQQLPTEETQQDTGGVFPPH